mmetsp:Transcript_25147/g.4158  ORF Transcript_25147/g.4158 Transcript_25147/m.4158 type:complete len:94 (+) Transcript_25147:816-1097(+)
MYVDAAGTADVLGENVYTDYPFLPGVHPVTTDKVQCILNRGMRPTLSVVGASGFPEAEVAGNVLRPYSTFKLSIRLPPDVDGQKAQEAVIKEL